jgi:hypothetical protein
MGTLTAAINKKLSLGGGTYGYAGVFTATGTYNNTGTVATSGETLATAAGERYSLPEKIDFIETAAGVDARVNGALIRLFGGSASGARRAELANATNLTTETIPFYLIGQ